MASVSGGTVSSLFTKTASTSNPSPKLHSSFSRFISLPLNHLNVILNLDLSEKIFPASDRKIGVLNVSRRFEVKARTAASKTIEGVEGGGNLSKAGLKSGDQVLYTSSFFGDELWPADKLGFTKTPIQAKPDSVYFVVSR
ncbi:hypothetical protein DY000_02000097 [Brassica cretica]|uniref:PDZ domain-containing protein n=1 Tax=Brassica cretica TaxID=69181 RepID=A0ABQ7C0F7_BRACR|nr:hypothetical protein DY000_02000097 [Brassica cretica]